MMGNSDIDYDTNIYLELLYIEAVIVFIEEGIEKVIYLLDNVLYGKDVLNKILGIIESGEEFPTSFKN